MSSSTPQFLSNFKQTLTTTRRPWSVFLDLSSLNLPSSLPDATTRISQNLTHFLFNYFVILLLSLVLSLIYHPLSLIAFFITLVGWVFLYFARDDPLTLLGHELSDLVVLAFLFALTFVVLVWSGVWVNVLLAVAIAAILVLVHAVLRSTDDLVADDIEASPYGNLLSDDDSPRGAYSGI